MNFSEVLKSTLKERGMKQADLCKISGIPRSLMSEYINGKKSPTITNAIAIASALNVTLDYLTGKKEKIILSEKENKLVTAYRSHPELQYAVDKLLGIDN